MFCGPSAAPEPGHRARVRVAHLAGITFSIHSPDELIAVISHMLGFTPEESIVFVPMVRLALTSS